MQGKVKVLKENQYHSRYGFIIGENGITYYFNKKSLGEGVDMSDLHVNDSIEFTIGQAKSEGSKAVANNILLLEEPVKFYSYGFSRSFDLQRMEREHLKKDSGEKEVLQKLKEILYITYGKANLFSGFLKYFFDDGDRLQPKTQVYTGVSFPFTSLLCPVPLTAYAFWYNSDH